MQFYIIMCHQRFKDKGSDRGGFGGRGRGRRDQSGTTETILMRIISPLNGTKSQTIGWKGHDGAVSWGQGGGDKGPMNWNSGTGRTSNQLRVN